MQSDFASRNKWTIKDGLAFTIIKGNRILIDPDDISLVSRLTWYVDHGYIRAMSGSSRVYLHRFLLDPPGNLSTDHVNGNRFDNRRQNIRTCNQSQNIANSGLRADNKSGIKGVWYNRKSRKYQANIHPQGKHLFLGSWKNIWDAAAAYHQASISHFGDFARIEIDYAQARRTEKKYGGAVVGTDPGPNPVPGRHFLVLGDHIEEISI